MKRWLIFAVTNLLVVAVLGLVVSVIFAVLGLDRSGVGFDVWTLAIFALVYGFAGAFISLFLSRKMAKMWYGVKVVKDSRELSGKARVAMRLVEELAIAKEIKMPDFWVWESPQPNAFATGWSKNSALVAVSTGLLEQLDEDGIRGVIAHEMAHVLNGDMVTMTLLQGLVNAFVIFLSRILVFVIQGALREERHSGLSGLAYLGLVWLFDIVLGALGFVVVMWYSRRREFAADAGSASMVGKNSMISALQQLARNSVGQDDRKIHELATLEISPAKKAGAWFASHPPLADRIAALQKL